MVNRHARPVATLAVVSVTPMRRGVLTFCAVLATMMQGLDGTIANVALPYMQGSMSASQEEIDWVLTSYIVAAAIMTTPTGFLASRFGRTRLFITAIFGFTLASVLCGTAQSLGQIVVFRILQGMSGAALVPLSQAVLLDIYPAEQRGSAMALWTMGALIGPVIGPTLGGWLTEAYNWRWVFFINVPFGVVSATGMLLFLEETSSSKSVKLDWLGFAALSLAIGSFQAMLDRGEVLDWFASREITIEACLAGIGMYIFLVQFSLAPRPFLSRSVFKDLNFVLAVVFLFIVGAILFATLALLAPYTQELMNYPVFTAGIVLAPRGAGSMISAFAAGWLLRVVSARILIAIGFLISGCALYEMALWTPDISEWTIINTGLLQGFGIGFLTVTLATVAFATLPQALRTEATGIFSLMRQFGSAIGISITAALLETNAQINHATISAAVTPFNRALQTGAVTSFWNPRTAQSAAALNDVITRQANIIAYADDFKLMFLLTVAALPFVILVKPAKPSI